MNTITIEQLRKMSYNEILNLCMKYPYESQWTNKDAYEHCSYAICLHQGDNYIKTGNIDSFKKVGVL